MEYILTFKSTIQAIKADSACWRKLRVAVCAAPQIKAGCGSAFGSRRRRSAPRGRSFRQNKSWGRGCTAREQTDGAYVYAKSRKGATNVRKTGFAFANCRGGGAARKSAPASCRVIRVIPSV